MENTNEAGGKFHIYVHCKITSGDTAALSGNSFGFSETKDDNKKANMFGKTVILYSYQQRTHSVHSVHTTYTQRTHNVHTAYTRLHRFSHWTNLHIVFSSVKNTTQLFSNNKSSANSISGCQFLPGVTATANWNIMESNQS